MLKPVGFFDRNPALDVPPTEAKCCHSVPNGSAGSSCGCGSGYGQQWQRAERHGRERHARMNVNALAAYAPGEALRPFEYEAGPLGAHQCLIKVHACGICHSDIHCMDNDWGMTDLPHGAGP